MMSPILSSQISWPANELETISACPVCGSQDRMILHEGLIDNMFSAPGIWSSWRCLGCHCSYLNPRPSRASIHLAYSNYHTHQTPVSKRSYARLSPLRKLHRRLVNGYSRWKYSAREIPATCIGSLVLLALWPLKKKIDREFCDLPRMPVDGGTLLDVGCGNGSFLEIARSCGWKVVGIDPDHNAIANCLGQGFDVIHGGIERFDGKEKLFDVITLNHVIEHMHDPVNVLRACHRLLKPTGQIWLETPNIDSSLHHYYMKNWRGLEPPRHLVLFNSHSLIKALSDAGFSNIQGRSGSSPLLYMAKESEIIKQGLPIGYDVRFSSAQSWIVRKNWLQQLLAPSCKELLTMVAFKDSCPSYVKK